MPSLLLLVVFNTISVKYLDNRAIVSILHLNGKFWHIPTNAKHPRHFFQAVYDLTTLCSALMENVI